MRAGETGAMKTRRTWHPTKAAWARAQADRLRAMERQTAAQQIPSSNWRAVRGKMRALDTLRRDAAHFERLAERFSE
jgi:hypothetical protein